MGEWSYSYSNFLYRYWMLYSSKKISCITHCTGSLLCPRTRVDTAEKLLAYAWNRTLLPRTSRIQHSNYIDGGNQFFTNTCIIVGKT